MTARVPLNTVRYGRHEMVQHEDSAAEDVTVGMLVEQTGDGFAPLSEAGVPQRVLVAYEDRGVGMQLDERGADYEYAYYPAGTNMKALQPSGGAEFTLWLANGETVAHGDGLVSNGDGTLAGAAADGTDAGDVVFEADLKTDFHDDADLELTADDGNALIDVVYTG